MPSQPLPTMLLLILPHVAGTSVHLHGACGLDRPQFFPTTMKEHRIYEPQDIEEYAELDDDCPKTSAYERKIEQADRMRDELRDRLMEEEQDAKRKEKAQ